MTKEVMNWNNIVGGKKAERIPCPDGIEGCLVAHYKVIQEQPKSSESCMTKEAIKQEQGKPVAWLIDDKSINHLQIKTIQRLIERANHAHMTDIKLRINGQDEWYEGDWIKHMVEAPQPNQEQGEQLARLGWQEIDCPICGGGARAFPKQEQERGEPVGSVMSWDGSLIHGWFGEPPPEGTLLYIKPQYRKPLTDDRIADIVREASHGSAIRRDGSTSMRIARAIESAHGIKE